MALERIPAIEAPPPDTPANNASSEPRESPQTPSENGGSSMGPDAEENQQKPSWWRRFFGFE
jgi:hypothetical protein